MHGNEDALNSDVKGIVSILMSGRGGIVSGDMRRPSIHFAQKDVPFGGRRVTSRPGGRTVRRATSHRARQAQYSSHSVMAGEVPRRTVIPAGRASSARA